MAQCRRREQRTLKGKGIKIITQGELLLGPEVLVELQRLFLELGNVAPKLSLL